VTIAQDRIETLPNFMLFLFDGLRNFCQTFDTEFNEFNKKLN
jgi:hypothetical protein